MSCKIITFFSNKGGVGKTFISLNLGTVLALAKKKVLMIDFDFQGGHDMARMLNLTPKSSIADIVPSLTEDSDNSVLLEGVTLHSCGLAFIPVVKNTRQAGKVTAENLKIFLTKAALCYDYIFVDGGMIFSETLVTVLDNSNLILLVATPDILAVYQVKWCLDVLQNLQFPLKMVKLILNRSESRGSVAWQEVRSALTCSIFGHIPSDGKTVGMALNRGVPCVIDSPKSRVSEAFIKMAQTLAKESFFVPSLVVERERKAEEVDKKPDFWEKFGITQRALSGTEQQYQHVDDETTILKRKIHDKLVDRLNQEGITTEVINNPEAVLSVKRTAEQVVADLLIEEAGGRIGSHEERVRLVRDIINEALGLGPLEDFLADPDITDIMVNNRHEIYVEKAGKLLYTGKTFVSDEKMRAIVDRIIAPLGRRIDESTPMVDARLPDGSRINAIIPPLSINGPMITIRKFGQERLQIGDLLEKHNSLTKDMADFLNACVLGRKNIIVSGGTGAGKTTLLNVISEFIPDGERIITLEDAAELRLKKSHWGRLESRPPNIEGRGQVTIRDLFVNCLRMRPDRIVIGECRGAEVLDMLQAMNTGHEGSLTTLHANSTKDALTRMHSMILLSGIELPVRAVNEMISSAIQIIVHINRYSDGTRKITGISETTGLSKDFHLELKDVFQYKQRGISPEGVILGEFIPTGYVPKCFEDFNTRGIFLNKNIFAKKG